MAATAGEKAWKTGTFVCQVCNEKVRVSKGDAIPKCPNGHSSFDERVAEPKRQRPLGKEAKGRAKKTSQARRGKPAGTSARGGAASGSKAASKKKKGASRSGRSARR